MALLVAGVLCQAVTGLASLAAEDEKEKEKDKEKEKSKSALSQYWTEDSDRYNLACENGSSFEKPDKHTLELKSGTFLVESEKDLTLRMPMSTIQLKPKCMVLVRVNADNERFYCLLQNASLQVEATSVNMHCGEEVFLANHNPKPAELTGEFEVGIRQLKGFDIAANRKMATMEFSIMQAMEREPLLVQISHSKHTHDNGIRVKLIKAAAVLNVVTNRHGPYAGF